MSGIGRSCVGGDPRPVWGGRRGAHADTICAHPGLSIVTRMEAFIPQPEPTMTVRALPHRQAAAAFLLLACACASPPADAFERAEPPEPCPRTADQRAAPFGDLAFGLFREVAEAEPDDNVFVSPLSLGLALGMVEAGARGETRAELGEVLGASGGALPDEARALRESLASCPAVQLEIASSLWSDEGRPLSTEYRALVRDAYGASAEALDLQSEAALDRINRWARERTHGKIDRILGDRLDPSVILILLNAVYFHGNWAQPFPKDATRDLPFHPASGGETPVPTMARTGSYEHHAGDGFRAIRLPYAGDRFRMVVVLPDSATALRDLRQRLSSKQWEEWGARFGRADVALRLPRFRVEWKGSLVEPLQAVGARRLFDPAGAQLLEIFARGAPGPENAYVADVLQKTFVEVDEEGTEAAAVTAVVIAETSAPPPPIEFFVDRPFLVAIEDGYTGAILFLGQITSP